MIETLFDMHNIKYVISVDDCYFAPKYDEVRAKVYSEMCCSIDPFRGYLTEVGKSSHINEIDEFTDLGTDTSALIAELIEVLSENELKQCFCEVEKTDEIYSVEQKAILAFLDDIKAQGYIEQYVTLSTVSEAAAFDCEKVGINNGSILWLLDRNFERVGESANAGIELAKTLTQRHNGHDNYVYILSAVKPDSELNEDEIEAEFDEFLSAECDIKTSSFFYYINKQRILSNRKDRIAKSLAQGFKRKASYELFKAYEECLSASIESATGKIFGIRQKTLDYLLNEKVESKGESCINFMARLVQILQTEEYNKAIAVRHDTLVEKMNYYEELCNGIKSPVGNATEMTPILKELRDIEIYNQHINSQYLELSTGDIFLYNSSYYLLVSQACDTYLRLEGCRKLMNATLLEIISEGKSEFNYPLSCFRDLKKPMVMYQNQISIPFDVLDLCVTNQNGQAYIDIAYFQNIEDVKLKNHSKNFNRRLQIICAHLKAINESKLTIERLICKDPEISDEAAKAAYETLLNEDSFLKNQTVSDNKLCFPVQRICRLNELTTIDIVKEYGIVLSRIGHPFDFLK
ncbi:hypothetical protein [Desulfosporosinus lacus]|uniref:Uncharacterized protein n=1 Tax=Desulfosporosinus lacus DSM 15449 TaxID=1121420 RepID=A0A1M5V141_9FIRM|nr:hypothetical protein [Desulfosporosinus lacus]SHH68854.1 hypothetical protein SAMN02746098_01151 [Desulfosporosinus lacus DSM 15449]